MPSLYKHNVKSDIYFTLLAPSAVSNKKGQVVYVKTIKQIKTTNQSPLLVLMDISPQVDQYILNIVENGTSVNQEVEVDEDEQTEVIRVPKRNNVDALELMNDFITVIHE